MEDAIPPSGSLLERTFSEVAADFDLMDEMLLCSSWLDNRDCSDLMEPGTSNSASPISFSPLFEVSDSSSFQVLPQNDNQNDTELPEFTAILPSKEIQNLDSGQSNSLDVSCAVPGQVSRLWMEPIVPISSVKERLVQALGYIKESQRDGDVLVQVWVPVKKGHRLFLTTCGQPFLLDHNSQRLVSYRSVSTNFQFSAEVNSDVALGLPGRVFVGKVPEWTPDVRYFSSSEYPRVSHAQHYDVRGSIALPIFERNNKNCIGVVEVVMTNQRINYSSDLETICNALQAVDLRSSDVSSVPHRMVPDYPFQTALEEIKEVLRAVCEAHRLPLAQAWIPCMQHGKRGSRHSEDNYKYCTSTVDAACCVNDPTIWSFHEACSEHHLLKGEGVVGKAFTTNEPCFSADITNFSKTEYPLSHHAKMFNLKAAVAILLRSIHTGTADFVLEFFLPVDCIENEHQKLMLNSLSTTIQQVCQSLRVVTAKELAAEPALSGNGTRSNFSFKRSFSEGGQRLQTNNLDFNQDPPSFLSWKVGSWGSSIMEAREKGESSMVPARIPLELKRQENEEFRVTTYLDNCETMVPGGRLLSEVKQLGHDSIDDRDFITGEDEFKSAGKAAEKRHTKTEKAISLQVLRQHFAGSLKDAARSLGVCPTTLKRICRQHGIARWPSRKIKKVGHSLKKLQVVIDSVQGAEGACQLSSLYENFTRITAADKNFPMESCSFPTLKEKDHSETSKADQQEAKVSLHTTPSSSLSSSCSQGSTSSLGYTAEAKQVTHAAQLLIKQEASMEGDKGGKLKIAPNEIDFQLSSLEMPISLTNFEAYKILGEHHYSGSQSPPPSDKCDILRVKATFGEDKIRFRLQPAWGFEELKQEVARRFNILRANSIDLKYLDDESEWVLITCDEDLQECIKVYKSSDVNTIRISVHSPQPSSSVLLDRTGLS